jgi:hypothetical protein
MKTLILLFAFSIAAFAQTKPEILILGTYHMANPGRDIFNMQADDVLSPKRQKEISELLTVLKKFKPTKVAIESDVWSKRRTDEYANYIAGKHTLTQNEIEQIGFRLAKEMGHSKIYPVDADGDFPMGRVMNYAKANGRKEQLDAVMAGWGALVKQQDEYLRAHTILEVLEYMNADARVTRDVGLYFELVRYGDPGDSAGADLLSAWYERNMRIYQNIVRLIESPDERVLVVYGSGHLGWLRQNVMNDPSVKLRTLADVTTRESEKVRE